MVCELKNLSEKNIRGAGGCEKKCPEAAENKTSHVLNTVFNTWEKIFRNVRKERCSIDDYSSILQRSNIISRVEYQK